MAHLSALGISRNIGIIYIHDAYGDGFHDALLQEANRANVSVRVSVPYENSSNESIESSMKILKNADVRYIIAIVDLNSWKPVVRAAHKYQIIGLHNPDYQWYMAEYKDIQRADFSLDPVTEWDVAEAIHGLGILYVSHTPQPAFEDAFQQFLMGETRTTLHSSIGNHNPSDSSSLLRDQFVASTNVPSLFDNVTWIPPQPNIYHYTTFDAMMVLGVAACQTPAANTTIEEEWLFTMEEFYEQLLITQFPSVSGWVQFDNVTGSRLPKDLDFRMDSVQMIAHDNDDDANRTTTATTSSRITFQVDSAFLIQGSNVAALKPFVYADNTTTPPSELPRMDNHDYNLMSLTTRAIGWGLGSAVILLSLTCMAWTALNRNRYVVRASQPIFLCQLCVGTLTMAMCVFPLSLQEEEDALLGNRHLSMDGTRNAVTWGRWNLDAACMATPWLFFLGFVTAFSDILSKTMRLNKLMSQSRKMKRIVVQPKDVLLPMVILMTLNVGSLLICKLVAPFQWRRVPNNHHNVDTFGRSFESYGTCHYMGGGNPASYYSFVPAVFANVVGIGYAVYQCYKALDLPTAMSESKYLLMASLSLMELIIIRGPILPVIRTDPRTFFLMASCIICGACLLILLPIFIPKYLQRHRGEAASRPAISISRRQRSSWHLPSNQSYQQSNNSLQLSNGFLDEANSTDGASPERHRNHSIIVRAPTRQKQPPKARAPCTHLIVSGWCQNPPRHPKKNRFGGECRLRAVKAKNIHRKERVACSYLLYVSSDYRGMPRF